MFYPSRSNLRRVEMKLADAMSKHNEKEGTEALREQRDLFLKNTSLINDDAMDFLDCAAGDRSFSAAFRLEAIKNIGVGLDYKPGYLNDVRVYNGLRTLSCDPDVRVSNAVMPLLGEFGAHCHREDWVRSFLEITKASTSHEAKEATRRIARVRCLSDATLPKAVPA